MQTWLLRAAAILAAVMILAAPAEGRDSCIKEGDLTREIIAAFDGVQVIDRLEGPEADGFIAQTASKAPVGLLVTVAYGVPDAKDGAVLVVVYLDGCYFAEFEPLPRSVYEEAAKLARERAGA